MALLSEFSTEWVGLNHPESGGFGLDRKEVGEFQVGENTIKRRKHVESNLGTRRKVTEGFLLRVVGIGKGGRT